MLVSSGVMGRPGGESAEVKLSPGAFPLTPRHARGPALCGFAGEPRWSLEWKIGVPGLCECAGRVLARWESCR